MFDKNKFPVSFSPSNCYISSYTDLPSSTFSCYWIGTIGLRSGTKGLQKLFQQTKIFNWTVSYNPFPNSPLHTPTLPTHNPTPTLDTYTIPPPALDRHTQSHPFPWQTYSHHPNPCHWQTYSHNPTHYPWHTDTIPPPTLETYTTRDTDELTYANLILPKNCKFSTTQIHFEGLAEYQLHCKDHITSNVRQHVAQWGRR